VQGGYRTSLLPAPMHRRLVVLNSLLLVRLDISASRLSAVGGVDGTYHTALLLADGTVWMAGYDSVRSSPARAGRVDRRGRLAVIATTGSTAAG
jgi:hypothetical protein